MRIYIRRPIRERLLGRLMVDLASAPGPDGAQCWIYAGHHRKQGGYATIGGGGRGHTLLAHRVAYELRFGPIPDGLDLDHLCRRPACCNPAHLEAVPRSVNLRRGHHGGGRPVGSKLAPATVEKIRQAALRREAARRVPWSREKS
jgi:hypothetical protein